MQPVGADLLVVLLEHEPCFSSPGRAFIGSKHSALDGEQLVESIIISDRLDQEVKDVFLHPVVGDCLDVGPNLVPVARDGTEVTADSPFP